MDSQHRDEIQRQMAALRSALAHDVSGSIDSAKLLADWRYHFRKHPALFCGAAALAGYLLVPSRRANVTVTTAPSPVAAQRAETQSIAGVFLGMALNALASRAIEIASHQGRSWLEQVLAPPESERTASWESPSATTAEEHEI